MAKRPSLAESMKALQPQAAPRVIEAPAPARGTEARTAQRPDTKAYYAATREGKKRITVLIEPQDHQRLRLLAAKTEKTMEDLGREAYADLFAKYGA